jgi:hypothetical protein
LKTLFLPVENLLFVLKTLFLPEHLPEFFCGNGIIMGCRLDAGCGEEGLSGGVYKKNGRCGERPDRYACADDL